MDPPSLPDHQDIRIVCCICGALHGLPPDDDILAYIRCLNCLLYQHRACMGIDYTDGLTQLDYQCAPCIAQAPTAPGPMGLPTTTVAATAPDHQQIPEQAESEDVRPRAAEPIPQYVLDSDLHTLLLRSIECESGQVAWQRGVRHFGSERSLESIRRGIEQVVKILSPEDARSLLLSVQIVHADDFEIMRRFLEVVNAKIGGAKWSGDEVEEVKESFGMV